MSYKQDNESRMRTLDAQWREERLRARFELDVQERLHARAVKAEVLRREGAPARVRAQGHTHAPRSTHPLMYVLMALGYVCKIIIYGVLAVLMGIFLGARHHKR